jgi:ribosomal protein S12 methylthiotransferase accessory factor
VLVLDVRPGLPEPLLTWACGKLVPYVRDLPAGGVARSVRVAIGVYAIDDSCRTTEFARWAQSAAVPVVTVGLGPRRALIGPLTIPGRPGCGHCAHQRMRAAAALGQDHAPAAAAAAAAREVTDVVRVLVMTEVAAIHASGPATSHLVDHVLHIDADSDAGQVTRHRVIPLSRCPVCGGAATLTEQRVNPNSSDSPTDGETGLLAGWVDPLTGVIPTLLADPPASETVSSPIVVTAAAPHVVDECDSLRRLPAGWGKGLTAAAAVRSAVGEAIERYSASLPEPARVIWERPDDLEGDILHPRQFSFYTEEQYRHEDFPYVHFDPAVCHPWVRGRWLGTGTDVWVPAVLVFLSMTIGPENLICQGTSNGLAASTDSDEAALRATLELVERDAFMVAWMTGACGRRVSIDESLNPVLGEVVESIEALGGSVELYLLPTAVCGTAALCLALGDGERSPGVTIGLGADLDPQAAVRQAILEVGQTCPYLSHLLQSGALRAPADVTSVRDMLDHAAFYFHTDRTVAFARIRASREAVTLGSLVAWKGERSLAQCASALEVADVRVAIVDVTSADVATGPFRVVRAVSPDLQTISYGHGLDRAPVERIRGRTLTAGLPSVHPIW